MEKREQAVGSSDPEDEDVETDEVKAKQLADQEVHTNISPVFEKIGKISKWLSFLFEVSFSSHNNVQSFECENVAKIVGFLTPCQF